MEIHAKNLKAAKYFAFSFSTHASNAIITKKNKERGSTTNTRSLNTSYSNREPTTTFARGLSHYYFLLYFFGGMLALTLW